MVTLCFVLLGFYHQFFVASYCCLSGKLWYLQYNCVGDTRVYHKANDVTHAFQGCCTQWLPQCQWSSPDDTVHSASVPPKMQCCPKSKILGYPTDKPWWIAGWSMLPLGGPYDVVGNDNETAMLSCVIYFNQYQMVGDWYYKFSNPFEISQVVLPSRLSHFKESDCSIKHNLAASIS